MPAAGGAGRGGPVAISAAARRGYRRHRTIAALDQALHRRCSSASLLHLSDQGSTYASEDYQEALREHGITCSMSRRGNCHDNAAMELWFSTFKFEIGETFESIRHIGGPLLAIRKREHVGVVPAPERLRHAGPTPSVTLAEG